MIDDRSFDDFEPAIDESAVEQLRAGPSAPSRVERATVEMLRRESLIGQSRPRADARMRTRPGLRGLYIAGGSALAACVVFALGVLVGSHRTRPQQSAPTHGDDIRAAGAAYIRALAEADPSAQDSRDAAIASFRAAGVAAARLAPDDEYGQTVRLALSDVIRMAPRAQPADGGAFAW